MALHFQDAPQGVVVNPAAMVLDDAERAFLAGLPEVRVGIPTVLSRPFEDIRPDGTVIGIQADLLAALAKTFGLRIRPVQLADWPSTLLALREHRIDLVLTLGVNTERLDYMVFTLGTAPMPGAVITRRDAPERLPAQAHWVVERGFLAGGHLRREYPKARIDDVETTLDALRAVEAGRAEQYLGSLLEVADLLDRHPMPTLEVRALMGYGTGFYHFGIRKDWPLLASVLNKGVHALRTPPADALLRAIGMLPPGVVMPSAMALTAAEARLLEQRSIWRVGAVRGLTMLNEVDAQGHHRGVAAEYTEQLARRLGVALQVVPFDNVAAMLEGLRSGAIDLIPFLTRTPEREREFGFSRPYVEMPYMIIARSDAPLYWDLDSLRGRRLAVALAHPVRALLAARYPEIVVVDAASGNQAMDMVAEGLADAAVEVKLFANLRIAADHAGALRAVAEVDQLPAQFSFAVRRDDAALLALVDRALADVPAAEARRILQRWVALDLQPALAWRRWLPLIAVASGALLLLAVVSAWWMRQLSREVVARRRSEALLNDVAATMPGVAFRYVFGRDGGVRHAYVSPAARTLFGFDPPPDRNLLASLADRLSPEDAELGRWRQREARRSGERFVLSVDYAHPDGRVRRLHSEAVRNVGRHDSAVWTGFVVDVSAEQALQRRLADQARERALVLASASHELRAPLNTLSLALQSMPEQGETTSIAREATRTLRMLLDDVLDAARLDGAAGGIRLHVVATNARALAEELASAWAPVARRKGLRLHLEVADELPADLLLDPLRIKQVLNNVLSNACKYTVHGSITMRVATVGAGELCFTVVDTGIGVDDAQRERVFQPFQTLDQRSPGDAGSSGLGLSVSRRIAELMGGTLAMDSAPGRGTTMNFCVPLQQSVAAAPASTVSGLVLVCDDDATSRLLLVTMLRQAGCEVEDSGDAAAALARWQRGGVAALITDLHMPGQDGGSLIRSVREAEIARGLPRTVIIVCSGAHPVDPAMRALDGLHDAMLGKPVDVQELLALMRRLGVSPAAA